MPGQTGFDLLDRIGNRNLSFIFITSYNQHAVRAFRYSAADYLLKPVDIDELKEAVGKVSARNDPGEIEMRLDLLADNLRQKRPVKILVSTGQGKSVVEIDNIIVVKAEGSYSRIVMTEGKDILLSKGLSSCESLLEELDFTRVHKSYLINMAHIINYTNKDGGVITMTREIKIPVSRRKKESFEKLFTSYFRV